MLVDSHAHLDHGKFDTDRPQVLARAAADGVAHILTIGTNPVTSRQAVALAAAYAEVGPAAPAVWAAVGVHPSDASEWNAESAGQLWDLAQHPRVRAWGEIGLDYYRDYPRSAQVTAFTEQIGLAQRAGLPMIIHCRNALDDVLALLARARPTVPVIMHSFTGNRSIAAECLARGYYLGVGGPLTYPANAELREAIRQIPLNRLLVETDCPFLPPQPWRGRRNEPAFIAHTFARLADIRGCTLEALTEGVFGNIRTLFGL